MRTGLAISLVLGAGIVLLLSCVSCGRSGLSIAYDAYDAKVEPLLAREIPLLQKQLDLLNDLGDEQKADPDRYESVVTKETVPFYDELVAKVAAIEAGDPALGPAHETLAKYARTRAALARHLAANLAMARTDPSDEARLRTQVAADQAMRDYAEKFRAESGIADTRITELDALQRQFTERHIVPMSQGTASGKDVQAGVRSEILPRVEQILATKFGDDAESKLVRKAAVTAKEFFEAFLANLPLLEQRSAFYARTRLLVKEGDDLLKKFKDELEVVRRRR